MLFWAISRVKFWTELGLIAAIRGDIFLIFIELLLFDLNPPCVYTSGTGCGVD